MPDQWYYTERGQQKGPLSTEELQRQAANGRLQPDDLVWKDGLIRWVPVSAVGEFAPRATPAEEPIPVALPLRAAGVGNGRRPPDSYDDEELVHRPLFRLLPKKKGSGKRVALGLGIGASILLAAIIVIVVIVNMTRSAATRGHQSFHPILTANGRCDLFVEFRGGVHAQIKMKGEAGTNVELRVFDTGSNQTVAESIHGFTDQRQVNWIPPTTRVYRIEVWNKDFNRNNVLVHVHTN